MQFISPRNHLQVLQKIYAGLNSGGAFIMAEKVYGSHARTHDMFTFQYYDFKRKSFTDESIMAKERDLRPIMRPQTEEENWAMIRRAGFEIVDIFWRQWNFLAFLCLKG